MPTLGGAPGPPPRFPVPLPTRSKPLRIRIPFGRKGECRVLVGAGILKALPALLASLGPRRRLFLLTDSRVRHLHGRRLLGALRRAGWTVHLLVVPAGERTKTRETKARLEDQLLALGAGRDALMIVLGGGVVSDLGGFLAATYLRGIAWVAVPTTLLAMVDAALGGKTGVNHPHGKNLIGAIHQPEAVLIDVQLLRTLPEREFRSGLAEVVKAGVIADAALFRLLERAPERILSRNPAALARMVFAACRVKARVVAKDEREAGVRAILNFGHTLGHALEQVSGYQLRHGEAVALGMVWEARAAVLEGYLSPAHAGRIEQTLRRLGLPVAGAGRFDLRRILAAARRDKKSRAGIPLYALPQRIGMMVPASGRFTVPLSPRSIRRALKSDRGARAPRSRARKAGGSRPQARRR